MRRYLVLPVLPLLLAACVSENGAAPALPPLAEDREEPALALIEHVLTDHFAAQDSADPPTTCVELTPGGLSPEQEQALIARFPRLAPRDRCETAVPPPEDGITGERAVVVQVYRFACGGETECAGWVSRPGAPATRYSMRFTEGAWLFEGDRRVLAE